MKRIYIFLFCLISLMIQAQVYDFPMKPGVKGWENLVTEDDRYAAMQVPEDILESMSTHDLIITCLNFPVMGHYGAFNTLQQGMDVLIQNFNGLQELMKREDAPTELLSLYKKMDAKTMKLQENGLDQSYWTIRRGFFEMLLTQEPILEKMDEKNQLVLMKEAQKRIYQKIDDEKEYSSASYQPTLMIISNILKKTADKSKMIDGDPITQFIADELLTANAAGLPQIYAEYTPTIIYTPKGTPVSAQKLVEGDYNSSQNEEIKNYYLHVYNNRITYLKPATTEYNCHAYAWYIIDGHPNVWLNNPSPFWNDGSFVLTTNPVSQARVSYVNGDHSAVVSSISGYVESKWGAYPLFRHALEDCPYYENSTSIRYYKYPDPDFATVPDKPFSEAFSMISSGVFTAEVSNDARYEVDLYEWKADYPSDWSIVPQNTMKSKVNVYQSSSPRSCYLSARAHNSYGWGEWQGIGWLYVSSSYSLSVLQNSGGATLQVQITPNAEMQNGDKAVKLENQTYQVALYSNTGVCVYQNTVNNNGTNVVNLNIDVSQISNGVYFLNVRNTKTNEGPQTMNIMIKH